MVTKTAKYFLPFHLLLLPASAASFSPFSFLASSLLSTHDSPFAHAWALPTCARPCLLRCVASCLRACLPSHHDIKRIPPLLLPTNSIPPPPFFFYPHPHLFFCTHSSENGSTGARIKLISRLVHFFLTLKSRFDFPRPHSTSSRLSLTNRHVVIISNFNLKRDKIGIFMSIVSTRCLYLLNFVFKCIVTSHFDVHRIPFKGTGKEYIGDDSDEIAKVVKKVLLVFCIWVYCQSVMKSLILIRPWVHSSVDGAGVSCTEIPQGWNLLHSIDFLFLWLWSIAANNWNPNWWKELLWKINNRGDSTLVMIAFIWEIFACAISFLRSFVAGTLKHFLPTPERGVSRNMFLMHRGPFSVLSTPCLNATKRWTVNSCHCKITTSCTHTICAVLRSLFCFLLALPSLLLNEQNYHIGAVGKFMNEGLLQLLSLDSPQSDVLRNGILEG